MNPHSLRFKLSWINGLVICLVIVLIGFIRYGIVSYRSSRSFDENLMADARFILSHLKKSESGYFLSSDGMSAADQLTLERMRPYIVVTDSEGKEQGSTVHSVMRELLSGGGFENVLKQRAGFAQASSRDGTVYRIVSVPLPGEAPNGFTLHLSRSMQSLQGVLSEYLTIYLVSVPVILGIAVTVGWYLAGRALKPFEEVAQTAEQITSKSLSTRIVTRHDEEEVRRLVEAFNAMVLRLDESFQQMRRFNADAAHELRTPISILQGEGEVALRNPDLPDDTRSMIASGLEELQRLTRIVNDMLTIAESDAGSQVLDRKPVHLRCLLEDLVEHMGVLAMERDMKIVLEGSADAVVEADALWLRRAFLNLLDNAIKYSRDGGRIEVRTEVLRDDVRITFRDEGIGISAADLPHIFQRSYRAVPARKRRRGGHGLGLALVKWIVESHEGTIRVESEVDRGTSFEVILPLAPSVGEAGGSTGAGPATPHGNGNLLILSI